MTTMAKNDDQDPDSSAFSPQTNPRPTYPSTLQILKISYQPYLRDAILGCCSVMLLKQPFEQLRIHLDWSDRSFFTLSVIVAHTGCFMLFYVCFYIFDEKLGWLSKYRFHHKHKDLPAATLISNMNKDNLINHIITTPLTAYYLFMLQGIDMTLTIYIS
mmetsp:Transcript_5880/g.7633  ORF Transcript_5880/g.7633 Transcript_5880/m.7633 type:complete len:159 (-) Transcript_5880:944-1420(-)